MKAIFARPVVILGLMISMMGLTACGSGGGSTSYFKTVTISPQTVSIIPDSTVLASGNTSDAAVTVTLQSTPYPGMTNPSPVTIKSSFIRYTKISPAAAAVIPDQLGGPAGPIPSGSATVFSFVTASGILKDTLVNSGFVPGVQKWQYYVTYYFTATEDYTNTSLAFSVPGGTITFQ